ncbi:uncharacterized protein LOC114325449 [Diabrotica virgifera virgifera]|uniref:Uncharacterized protein LOC114325449 n=1 Tax=Diabrotica virgifera virgifera TaxID=50390 RepID=A0A6P7F6E2_DIAVI|nr:uncharacterized protein LOC114325449 [Diabrotica virgifera virgifera]
MSLNSSNPIENPLTFRQLEYLISQWEFVTEEFQERFQCQNEAVNKLLDNCCANQRKLLPIDRRIIKSKTSQQHTECLLEYIYNSLLEVEKHLVPLEKDVMCTCIDFPEDLWRYEIYNKVESVYALISNAQQALTLTQMDICSTGILLPNKLCKVVYILNVLLNILEYCEAQINKMEIVASRTAGCFCL